jgi:hypothetical protein
VSRNERTQRHQGHGHSPNENEKCEDAAINAVCENWVHRISLTASGPVLHVERLVSCGKMQCSEPSTHLPFESEVLLAKLGLKIPLFAHYHAKVQDQREWNDEQ